MIPVPYYKPDPKPGCPPPCEEDCEGAPWDYDHVNAHTVGEPGTHTAVHYHHRCWLCDQEIISRVPNGYHCDACDCGQCPDVEPATESGWDGYDFAAENPTPLWLSAGALRRGRTAVGSAACAGTPMR